MPTKKLQEENERLKEQIKSYNSILNYLMTNDLCPNLGDEDFKSLKKNLKTIGRTKYWGICPFPSKCKDYDKCEAISCDANSIDLKGVASKKKSAVQKTK